MQPSQRYMLTIHDLFTITGGVLCGAEAEVAILDDGIEINRMKFSGKVGPGGPGYRRSFTGKPGLTAKLVTGPCHIQLAEETLHATLEA
ncbi:hypothetical protein A3218_01935 [Pseudomonas chlororaphis]|uniref:hypothetical protein n=1 Tax=Pseudomonas chlororaphis TaxID=587753 RepID=UPI000789E3D0|nr:hypothetical protein [Pseudomonas chlororaphis]AMS18359.1 hypothetical protein A3218_01935 [Pseudomonas chlororaphis]